MTPELLQMVTDRDEVALERAFFDATCPDFFALDWRGDDADTVNDCAKCLHLPALTAEWRGDDLFILYAARAVRVPLQMDVADRHITICTVNDVISPGFEVRFLVFSHGSDTLGFTALSGADWRRLEEANAEAVAENFIDPRQLPNLMTELTDEKLPAKARARFERMLARIRARR